MKWEYFQVIIRTNYLDKLPEKLNEYGDEGWELVSSFGVENKEVGFFDSGSKTTEIVLIFKRQKQ